MSAAYAVNVAEILLWGGIGITLLIYGIRPGRRDRSRILVLSITFLLFSVSDYCEIQSGGWWKPIWLLGLKLSCVAVIASSLLYFLKRRNPRRKEE